MNLIYIWIVAYAIPALVAGMAVKLLPRTKSHIRNAAIMHSALVLSIALSQYFIWANGLSFPWDQNIVWIFVYIGSVAIATSLLGAVGLWYSLSALLQQATMVSIAFLLLLSYPFGVVALVVAPLYVWCHPIHPNKWIARALLFLAWGVASVFLFSLLQNIYLLAALHTLFGSLLISRSFLSTELELFRRDRSP